MRKPLFTSFDSEVFFELFANAVRVNRQELYITQLELIEILQHQGVKVSQAYLSQIEAGQRKEPSARIVICLAAVLNIDIDELITKSR